MPEHVLILGGGVIGLSCAWACRQRGHRITVLETGLCGGQASGAAAGMLAPYSENAEGADAFFRLGLASLRLYPDWQREIKLASGMDFEYNRSGSLQVVFHEADLLPLEERLSWQREYGMSGSIVQGEALFALEPQLARNAVAALHIPEESHVYAPDYVRALEAACRAGGVQVYDRLESVEPAEWSKEAAVRTADGRTFGGDRLVIATGAWSQRFEPLLGVRLPVFPIRGQICAYAADPDRPIRHMVFGSQGYVVSKANGTVVCGASEDVAGFDTSVTPRGIGRLLRWSRSLFPFLSEAEPVHTWAGLRPATQDGFPLLGRLRGSQRVLAAVGHYRNGILLSPVTGTLIADLLDGAAPETDLGAFAPDRFGAAAAGRV